MYDRQAKVLKAVLAGKAEDPVSRPIPLGHHGLAGRVDLHIPDAACPQVLAEHLFCVAMTSRGSYKLRRRAFRLTSN
jgi:hypothetical protein